MKKNTTIQIPDECHESWDGMQTVPSGRHCAQCSKTVIDFTTWSDTALYDFFRQQRSGICGSFHESQLARPIIAPVQPHGILYRAALTLGFTILIVQLNESVFAQAPMKHSRSKKVSTPRKTPPPDSISITGRVLEASTNKPLTNSTIRCYTDNGSQDYTVTAVDGAFKITVPSADFFRLEFYYGSYSPDAKTLQNTGGNLNAGDVLLHRNLVDEKPTRVEEIRRMGGPMTSTDLVALSPGIYQRRRGADTTHLQANQVAAEPAKHKRGWFSWLRKKR